VTAPSLTKGSAAPPPGPTGEAPRQVNVLREILASSTLVVVLAVLLALLVAALLIAAADEDVQRSFGYLFDQPNDFVYYFTHSIGDAFTALFFGSVLNPEAGTTAGVFRPITETLTFSVPLIFAGLGLGIGFRAGLFNIGAQGQIILGAVVGGFVGFGMDLPAGLHLLLAVVGAFVGGAFWGGIAGFLKARTGANEVIVTIMLNSVALYLIGYLLTTELFQGGSNNQPISPPIPGTAKYPLLLGEGFRLHLGFLLALLTAAGVWWLMERSTLGFQFRALGVNPHAARTAGMDVENGYLWAMALAGGLAGLGGSAQILGTESALTAGIAASFGFDAITVALLGRSRPVGTVLAAILFGALRAGGFSMQGREGIPVDLILVVQSLIVLFIAAPPLVRGLFRLPSDARTKGVAA
jgi:simple sugar transport system permease protein